MIGRKSIAAVAAISCAALLPMLAAVPGSAARLEIHGAAGQVWHVPVGPPALLEVCGDVEDYDEIVYGTDGDDRLVAGNGRSILVGGAGDDILVGGNHNDCLIGGAGDDDLQGGNGRDILWGGRGDDRLDGGTGKDTMLGGSGQDVCVSSGAPDLTSSCSVERNPGRPTGLPSDEKPGADKAKPREGTGDPGPPAGPGGNRGGKDGASERVDQSSSPQSAGGSKPTEEPETRTSTSSDPSPSAELQPAEPTSSATATEVEPAQP